MNVSRDMPAGVRRCALALHALHSGDREWMLEQLGGEAAHDVRRLLAELAELGLPPDASIVRQALAPNAPIVRVDPQAWANALAREPLGLVAAAVRDLPNEQRDAILQRLGVPRERQVRQRLDDSRRDGVHAPRLSGAVDAAVRAAVRECLGAAAPLPRRPSWAGAWRRWREARA